MFRKNDRNVQLFRFNSNSYLIIYKLLEIIMVEYLKLNSIGPSNIIDKKIPKALIKFPTKK